MQIFELGIKKVRHGYAIIKAESKEEAIKKLKYGEAKNMTIYPEEDTIVTDCQIRKKEDIDY